MLNAEAWAAHNAKRWMRPDAARFARPIYDANALREGRAVHAAGTQLVLAGLRYANLLLKGATEEEEDALNAESGGGGHWENQPRAPAGGPDGGQWVSEGGGESEGADRSGDQNNDDQDEPAGDDQKDDDENADLDEVSAAKKPNRHGIGGNGGPPLKQTTLARITARFLSRGGVYGLALAGMIGAFEDGFSARQQAQILSYQDPPDTFENLQSNAWVSGRIGYENHHIAEKASAKADGFLRSQYEGPDNIVNIPKYKHEEITGYYMTKNEAFGGLSPREYLQGKSWEERTRVGRETLILFGVMKP